MLNKKIVELSGIRLQKSRDSLRQSKILLDNKMFDGSINRTYYAIFYSIRSILALVKLDSSKHVGILSLFDRFFVKTGIFDKQFSKIAHIAFDVRQDSDYDDFYFPIEQESLSYYKNAEKFIEEIERVRSEILSGNISLPNVSKS